MKISEVPDRIILKNCNAYEEDIDLIEVYKDAAKSYIKNYTGLSDEELDKYDDLTTAYLCIISDMYDNRTFTQALVSFFALLYAQFYLFGTFWSER